MMISVCCNLIYLLIVRISGIISKFEGSQKSENLRCFLDKLKNHQVNLVGTLKPKHNNVKARLPQ